MWAPAAYRKARRTASTSSPFSRGNKPCVSSASHSCRIVLSIWPTAQTSFRLGRSAEQLYDPEKGANEYESYIDHLVLAEALGFDAIAVNEHHQTAYGMMPAPNLIASALIQRTSG